MPCMDGPTSSPRVCGSMRAEVSSESLPRLLQSKYEAGLKEETLVLGKTQEAMSPIGGCGGGMEPQS